MAWTPESEMRPYTETSALEDILEWSRDRPGWLRDALRRLLVGGELSDRDIDELEEICLGNGGESFPLSDEHIAPQRLAGKPVAITGLRDPLGVNALARGQGLTFAASGLTIVYGDNGSGKSGFVRVLKSACRSRDEKTAIRLYRFRGGRAGRDIRLAPGAWRTRGFAGCQHFRRSKRQHPCAEDEQRRLRAVRDGVT